MTGKLFWSAITIILAALLSFSGFFLAFAEKVGAIGSRKGKKTDNTNIIFLMKGVNDVENPKKLADIFDADDGGGTTTNSEYNKRLVSIALDYFEKMLPNIRSSQVFCQLAPPWNECLTEIKRRIEEERAS